MTDYLSASAASFGPPLPGGRESLPHNYLRWRADANFDSASDLATGHREASVNFRNEIDWLLRADDEAIRQRGDLLPATATHPIEEGPSPRARIEAEEGAQKRRRPRCHSDPILTPSRMSPSERTLSDPDLGSDDVFQSAPSLHYSSSPYTNLPWEVTAAVMKESMVVEIFGSSLMELVLPGTSDIDLNVSFDLADPIKTLGPQYKQKFLGHIEERIELHPRIKLLEIRRFARVPLIKVEYTTVLRGGRTITLDGDITLSHTIPRYNSRLVRAYGQYDPLVRRLMMMTKLWTYRRGIRDASNGYLSSYSWMLLVVFYAKQTGLVPNLQNPSTEDLQRYGVESVEDITREVPFNDFAGRPSSLTVLDYPDILHPVDPDDACSNLNPTNHCLLFIGFMEFLDAMNWETDYISLRHGELHNKNSVLRSRLQRQRWRWSIEDPFEHFDTDCPRDLGCVLKQEKVAVMQYEIRRSLLLLRRWYSETYMSAPPHPEDLSVHMARETEAEHTLHVMTKGLPCMNRRSHHALELFPLEEEHLSPHSVRRSTTRRGRAATLSTLGGFLAYEHKSQGDPTLGGELTSDHPAPLVLPSPSAKETDTCDLSDPLGPPSPLNRSRTFDQTRSVMTDLRSCCNQPADLPGPSPALHRFGSLTRETSSPSEGPSTTGGLACLYSQMTVTGNSGQAPASQPVIGQNLINQRSGGPMKLSGKDATDPSSLLKHALGVIS